jgi:EAL domain-containing protein (putative c-di-GMP-specific phosphodiesterase class I)
MRAWDESSVPVCGASEAEHVLVVRVENYAQLRRNYGVPFAHAVEQELQDRIRAICGSGAKVTERGEGQVGIHWRHFNETLSTDAAGLRDRCRADLLLKLSRWARHECGSSSLAILKAEWVGPSELASTSAKANVHLSANAWGQSPSLVDMDVAARVYRAIGEGRVALAYQPIRGTQDIGAVLYSECLMRIRPGPADAPLGPAQFIPSLERLGLMRFLDNYVVRRVVADLKRHPDKVLGVNISAQSAIDDFWWAQTFSDLATVPDAAGRLIVEITETAQVYPGAARLFCNRLRQLGCRIAVDDFGAGFSQETGLELRHADIVKVDASILRGGGASPFASDLRALVDIARGYADQVVVEGIESEADLELARRAGASWGQGNYLARPVGYALGLHWGGSA